MAKRGGMREPCGDGTVLYLDMVLIANRKHDKTAENTYNIHTHTYIHKCM